MPPSPRKQAVADENKDTSPAAPLDAAATAPEGTVSETPVHDQLVQDLESASDEERTAFEEDDDPLSHVGEVLDDDDDDNPDKETR